MILCNKCIHAKVCSGFDIVCCPNFFEIVRCKDCKFCEKHSSTYLCFRQSGGVAKKADGFCDYGERKETK